MSQLPILEISISYPAGREPGYSLMPDGSELRGTEPGTVTIATFLARFGPLLERLVAKRVAGWDQVRVHYDESCRPIYDLVIQLPSGGHRRFGVYGYPYAGSQLERGGGPVDPDLVELFAYCLPEG